MKSSWIKRISASVLGVGLGLATGAAAHAQGYPAGQPMYPGYAPQGYGAPAPYPYNPYAPQGYRPIPTYPYPAPAYGVAPPVNPYQTAVRPPETAGQATTAVPTSTAAPATLPPAADAKAPAAPIVDPAPSCDMTQPPCESCGPKQVKCLDTVNTAAFIGMEGRDDAYNRFNNFSNNEALPTNRLWFGYQYEDRFSPGVLSGDPALMQKRQVSLYRMGGEVMLGCNFSIAFQDQYVGVDGLSGAWGNPDVMLKLAFINEECRIWSLVLGVQPQAGNSPNELHERTTRYTPGFLGYHSYGDSIVVQSGLQVGVSTDNAPDTVDYILSFGYWVYRDPRLDIAGRPIKDCTGIDCKQWRIVSGILPQVELMGTNVFAHSRGPALDTPVPGGTTFYESRNVYDLTVGLRVLVTPYVSLNGAWSFPFMHENNRRSEVVTGVNVTW